MAIFKQTEVSMMVADVCMIQGSTNRFNTTRRTNSEAWDSLSSSGSRIFDAGYSRYKRMYVNLTLEYVVH